MAKRSTLKSHFKIQREELEEEEKAAVADESAVADEATALDESAVGEDVPTEKEPYKRVLNKSEVSVRLSCLGKIATGDAYTYLKATCTNMSLTEIRAIVNFKHLQFVDVSNNKLTLENLQAVTELPYLLLLQADHNLLDSAALKKCKYLQVIIMNNNEIKSCHDVFHPNLSTLELGYNKITKVTFDRKMADLKCLDFRYNLINEINDWHFPNLVCLYLAGNNIRKLDGIEKLPNLRILHLRNNPIKKLDKFHENMKLFYINLRSCKVKSLVEIKKLKVLPELTTLILKGTPFMGGSGTENDQAEEDEEVRVQIAAALPKLGRINKIPLSELERAEAKELMMQWIVEDNKEVEEEEEEDEETNVVDDN